MKKVMNEAIAVSQCISNFLNDYAPKHKTGSLHTIKSYKNALEMYIKYLEQDKKITPEKLDWSCFEKQYIEGWMVWLADERHNKPETCNVRLASLREFLKYAADKDIQVLSFYQNSTTIKKRKCTKKKVHGLTKEAIKNLLEMPDTSTRTGRRDLVLMIVLYATAARLDELLSMKISQLKLDGTRPYINIIGKGDKTRTLYLLPKAVSHLKKYIFEFHGDKPKPDAYLFYSKRTDKYSKLTQPAVAKRLKEYAEKAHMICEDVPLGLHAHQFRHARASHWLEEGINIVQISFLLGHAQLQTTMVYLDISTEDELKALAVLEDENDKKVSPKWKRKTNTLTAFCGFGK